MPLTTKGEKIMGAMKSKYGEKEGERVFYASRNKGRITGVDDFQHMGFTSAQAKDIKHIANECDSLSQRLDAFEKRRAMQRPSKVKPRTKDGMQPSNPHPKEVG